MKIAVLCIALLAFSACSKEDRSQTQVNQNAATAQVQSAQASSAVPLNNTHCPVTGAQIGSMGSPVMVEHQGKSIALCCRGCAAEFAKNPEKYMKILAQQGNAPVQSGDPSGHEDHSGHNH